MVAIHPWLAAAAILLAAGPVLAQDSTFADIANRASQARLANRSAEAIALYRDAVRSKPDWTEGWFYLGTLLYDTDRTAEAAEAFAKAAALNPNAGTAWVMLGLSEFALGKHADALSHIQRGRALGVAADPQLRHVMLYHEGLLLLGASEFERAQEALEPLAAEGVALDELLVALGRAVLRLSSDASVKTAAGFDLAIVRRAGWAAFLAAQKRFDDARREYESLGVEHPETRNVHYALARHLASIGRPEPALAAYRRELANFPDHVPALIGAAAILGETDAQAALTYAEAAVKINPGIPLGHYVLGSLLLKTDQIERAIAELERAEREVKNDPGVYYALGRAYSRVGRTADADRARAAFKRLTHERQKAAERDK